MSRSAPSRRSRRTATPSRASSASSRTAPDQPDGLQQRRCRAPPRLRRSRRRPPSRDPRRQHRQESHRRRRAGDRRLRHEHAPGRPVADYLVVNVSSPNTPGLRGLQAVETLRPLLEAVRDAAGIHAAPREDRSRPARRRDRGDRAARRRSRARRTRRDQHDDRAGAAVDARRRRRGDGAGGLSGRRCASAPSPCCGRPVVVPAEFCVVSAGEWRPPTTCANASLRDLVQGYTAFIYRGPFWARQINRALARTR
jgi:hypothetical protein